MVGSGTWTSAALFASASAAFTSSLDSCALSMPRATTMPISAWGNSSQNAGSIANDAMIRSPSSSLLLLVRVSLYPTTCEASSI